MDSASAVVKLVRTVLAAAAVVVDPSAVGVVGVLCFLPGVYVRAHRVHGCSRDYNRDYNRDGNGGPDDGGDSVLR